MRREPPGVERPFTGDWVDVLWAVRLSLVASIAANAMCVAYDADWFRHLTGSARGAGVSPWWSPTRCPIRLPSAFIAEVAAGDAGGDARLSIAILAQFVHLLAGAAR